MVMRTSAEHTPPSGWLPSYTHQTHMNAPCHCPAYRFPHRAGSGRCQVDQGPVCSQCGELCGEATIDDGIGWTEFWGRRSYDSRICTVSDCCHAEVIG